jgi:glycosyltransferase involved in cell wall biosynthesis
VGQGRRNTAERFRVLMILNNPCNPDLRVLKEATSLGEAGFEVTILAWDRTGQLPAEERTASFRIVRIRTPSRHGIFLGRIATALGFWTAVARAALAKDFDAVHCHDLPDLPVGVFLSALKRRPLVYDAHELYWMDRLEIRSRPVTLLERYGERVLIHRARHVITISEDVAAYYRRLHPRVSVVGNWYDPIKIDRTLGGELRRELGIADDTFCLVYAGSLGSERNHQLLIEYAAAFADTAVIVAGRGGAAEAEFRQAARTLPNLRFLDWQSDMRRVYGLADALYYVLREDSSYRAISSPNNFFISIATGIPLITTASGEPGGIIAETGAGQLLPASSVADLRRAVDSLRNPEVRASVIGALSSLQSRYTWKKAVHPLLEAYGGLRARRALG